MRLKTRLTIWKIRLQVELKSLFGKKDKETAPKKKIPVPVVIVRATLAAAIALFVVMVVLMILMYAGVLKGDIAIFFAVMVVPLLLLACAATCVGVRFSSLYKYAVMAEKDNEGRADADKYGEVFCTKEQMTAAYNILDNYDGHGDGQCPICGEALEYDSDWEYLPTIRVREKREGVYIAHSYSNEVEQAYEMVEKDVSVPAVKCRCPKCRWVLYRAEHPSLESKSAKTFDRGKLYHRVVIHYDNYRAYAQYKFVPKSK